MRARGFTLLEILAALVLLSLLLVGVWSGIDAATHAVHRGERAATRMDLLRAAQGYLRREWQETQMVPWGRTEDGHNEAFLGEPHRVRFVAPLPGYLGRLGPQLQTVELVPDGGDGKGLRLQVQLATLRPGRGATPLGPPQVLLRGIRSGTFEYRGYNNRRQPQSWDTHWPAGLRLPALVRLRLRLNNGRHWPTLTVPIRAEGGSQRMLEGPTGPGVEGGP